MFWEQNVSRPERINVFTKRCKSGGAADHGHAGRI